MTYPPYPEGPVPEEQPPIPGPLKPHRGQTILVLGIVGIVFSIICAIVAIALGIIAWLLASKDLREMDQGLMDPAGRSLTNAGRLCGIAAIVLGIVGVIVGIYRAMTLGPELMRQFARPRR